MRLFGPLAGGAPAGAPGAAGGTAEAGFWAVLCVSAMSTTPKEKMKWVNLIIRQLSGKVKK
jgi:hypothetical protein